MTDDVATTAIDDTAADPHPRRRVGVLATTMQRVGWPWGARWSHPDYQHFSANGG